MFPGVGTRIGIELVDVGRDPPEVTQQPHAEAIERGQPEEGVCVLISIYIILSSNSKKMKGNTRIGC